MKNILPFGALLCGLALFFTACETDDIEPSVSVTLTALPNNVSEDLGVTNIFALLNVVSDQPVTIKLTATGEAINTIDYTLSGLEITIPAGSLDGSIALTALQDTLEEGNESINISVASIIGAEPRSTQSVAITLIDDDVVAPSGLVINELLFDPPSAPDGDANGDGVRGNLDDEFIEFYNASDEALDISGYKMYDTKALDDQAPRHIFPANTVIPSNKALVLFGGGTPTGTFGGSIVQTATNIEINLSNNGDIITITNTADSVIVTFEITAALGGNGANESYTRNPDITGNFEKHSTNTPLLFSPGTKIDGTSF